MFQPVTHFQMHVVFTDKRFWSFCRSRLLVQRFKQRVIECTKLFFVVAEKEELATLLTRSLN